MQSLHWPDPPALSTSVHAGLCVRVHLYMVCGLNPQERNCSIHVLEPSVETGTTLDTE